MTKVAVDALTGAALNWAVAKCEWVQWTFDTATTSEIVEDCHYSTNWAQGGPIIEREVTKIFRNVGGTWSAMILKDVPIPPEDRGTSLALTQRMQWNAAGPTPLIAAMRCYVASKLGDLIEIPEELFE